MDEDDRKRLYGSLLRGLANTAQDRLCAGDSGHAWGPWERYQVEKDIPLRPITNSPTVCKETILIRSERRCKNCGKEDVC